MRGRILQRPQCGLGGCLLHLICSSQTSRASPDQSLSRGADAPTTSVRTTKVQYLLLPPSTVKARNWSGAVREDEQLNLPRSLTLKILKQERLSTVLSFNC